MNYRKYFYIILCSGLTLLLLSQFLFVVNVTEYAVVTRFGNPVKTHTEAGLKIKRPFPFEKINRFDSRKNFMQLPRDEYLTRDKKNIMVESYLVWRIDDPIQFMKVVGTKIGAEARLTFSLSSIIGAELGNIQFSDLISDKTDSKLPTTVEKISVQISREAQTYGINIIDMQINRLNYHEQNRLSVFERMKEERRQIATRFRSEGEEEDMKIRAATHRDRSKIITDAEIEASKIISEGEAEAARIYAEAIKQNPDFYRFQRSLKMYENIFNKDDSIIIPADSELMRYLLGDISE